MPLRPAQPKSIRTITSVLIIIILSSCNQEKEVKFSLKGTTNGLGNGTVLYLFDPSTDKTIDSVEVQAII